MENQPNQPQPTKKPSNQALWIILVLVVLAIAGYGVYAYVSQNTNNANKNANQNNNIVANANTNTKLNTNIVLNTNTVVNINSTTDTSSWYEYVNTNYAYSIKVPSDWIEVSAFTGKAQEIQKASKGLNYIIIQESLDSNQEIVISIDQVSQDNVLDYIYFLMDFSAPDEEYEVTKIKNGNSVAGYKVFIPEHKALDAHLGQNNYFFWHHDRVLSIKMMGENDTIDAILNSLKLN